MISIDAKKHVRGESLFVDDIPEINRTLYGLPFDSDSAHAKIIGVDLEKAASVPGIVRILTYKDIPGENQIGCIVRDEPLFAESEVHYRGQPVGLIIGTSEQACRKARRLIRITYKDLHAVTCPREAAEKDLLIIPPRTFVSGNTSEALKECEYVFEGRADIGGQEHLYIETQGSYAHMKEDGSLFVASSTQGPTAVQRTIAGVLSIPMHRIEVDTVRIGGGFGGKEDQATPWAVMAALGTLLTGKPVKVVLHRMDDMRMTGKRNPYSADYRIGLSRDLKILSYEVTFYQNAGAAADLSPAILERTLFHCTNAYYIPNVTAKAISCKTNLPPNTAFRGFGGPQGKFVIETAIVKAAEELNVSPDVIQKINLLDDGNEFPYGQVVENCEARNSWNECLEVYDLEKIKADTDEFNKSSFRFRKGYAVQPICFGISFTNTMMNQARALVHIYHDGSVVISTGAVEMGQGVNTKLVQVAAGAFGINAGRVRVESTNTLRIANTSPTAASSGADLNGKALLIACNALMERLKKALGDEFSGREFSVKDETVHIDGVKTELSWQALVLSAFQKRISLSEHAHYATPLIHFDKTKEKGHPFAYHVYGTAIITATVDCLKGTYEIDSVKIMHDSGNCMNEEVDMGQIEGGVVQGIGWMTFEEVLYNEEGKLLSNSLSTYKVPDVHSVPKEIIIRQLNAGGSDFAIKKSKAVGEPPFMYGLGAYFAVRKAVRSFNPDADPAIDPPYTPEKVLKDLYSRKDLKT